MYFPSRRIARTGGGGLRINIQGHQYPISFVKARFVCIHCLHNLMSRNAGVVCSANNMHYGYIKKDEAVLLSQEARFMKIGLMFPSEYLRGIDLNSPAVLTIASVKREMVKDWAGGGPDKLEHTLTFKETDKALRIGMEKAKDICTIHNIPWNSDTDPEISWPGKQICVYGKNRKVGGKMHFSTFVRLPKKSDKPFGATLSGKKNGNGKQPAPAYPKIDDLLYALSKPPCNLKEDEAKKSLKALQYKGFKPSKSQEMYDSVVAYLAQGVPTDDEKHEIAK